jgi:hypothetical protein
MIYRDISGNLIEINRFQFKNDKSFYQNVMNVKKPFSKLNETEKTCFSNYIIQSITK